MKIIHNVKTGEITTEEFDSQELAEIAIAQAKAAELAAKETEAKSKRTAALAKLEAFGLTDDDLKALGL